MSPVTSCSVALTVWACVGLCAGGGYQSPGPCCQWGGREDGGCPAPWRCSHGHHRRTCAWPTLTPHRAHATTNTHIHTIPPLTNTHIVLESLDTFSFVDVRFIATIRIPTTTPSFLLSTATFTPSFLSPTHPPCTVTHPAHSSRVPTPLPLTPPTHLTPIHPSHPYPIPIPPPPPPCPIHDHPVAVQPLSVGSHVGIGRAVKSASASPSGPWPSACLHLFCFIACVACFGPLVFVRRTVPPPCTSRPTATTPSTL
jgi:hypothetical protein